MRYVVLPALLLATAGPPPELPADWAEQLFEVKTHDFGRVPAGAKAEHDFVVTNVLPFEVEIARTRVTCECTEPKVAQAVLRPGERTTVSASLATSRFHGRKGATITVSFSRPQFAEVQLHVTAYIDKHVEIDPPSIDLGTVAQGRPAEKETAVACTGNPDWRIVEVRSANPRLTGSATETVRTKDAVRYALRAKLDATAPGGPFKDVLVLVTNDAQTPEVPVLVHGRVLSELEVSPSVLFMGVTAQGGTLSKVLVVRGKRPFKVLAAGCDAPGFEFRSADAGQARPLHLVTVTFTPGTQTGKINGTIRIRTDLAETPAEVPVQAVVAPSRGGPP